MILIRLSKTRRSGTARVVVLIVALVAVSWPPAACAAPGDEAIYERFERVGSLRAQGEYETASEILRDIIREYSNSEVILRRAYSELVFTLLSKDDANGADGAAREALAQFPDLTADNLFFPPRVNEIYDDLRARMFGSISVTSRPDSCRAFLDDDFIGFTPLSIEYAPVGQYVLSISKAGYLDESRPVRIDPGSASNVQLSLERQRDKKWWLWRIAPATVLSGVLLAIQLSSKDEGGGPSPLPGPPPPPGD
jgi:hypothetical protein